MARGIRLVALACLWLAPVLILSTALLSDWTFVWQKVGVPSYLPPFLDLRSITSGLKTVRQGGDPLLANPYDPLHRTMNYPRIWLHLFTWMGINDRNLWMVGVLFCVLYLIAVSWFVLNSERAVDAVIFLLTGLGLAPLFAIERGNSDLLIFALVLAGCLLGNRFAKAAVFFAGAVLKIFPVAALLVDSVRGGLKKGAAALGFATAAFLAFAWQWHDLQAIKTSTPVSTTLSFGLRTLRAQAEFLSAAQLAGCAALLAIILAASWIRRPHMPESVWNSQKGELFAIFGGIYLFSFVMGSNWDYRLIFQIPTLPLVLDLAREKQTRIWAIVYLVAFIVAENSFIAGVYQGIPAIDVSSAVLFAMLLSAFGELPALRFWQPAMRTSSGVR